MGNGGGGSGEDPRKNRGRTKAGGLKLPVFYTWKTLRNDEKAEEE